MGWGIEAAELGNAKVAVIEGMIYLFLTQKKRPVRPRNHKHPMKRTSASTAVAHRRAWKKCAVRLEELDCCDVSDSN